MRRLEFATSLGAAPRIGSGGMFGAAAGLGDASSSAASYAISGCGDWGAEFGAPVRPKLPGWDGARASETAARANDSVAGWVAADGLFAAPRAGGMAAGGADIGALFDAGCDRIDCSFAARA